MCVDCFLQTRFLENFNVSFNQKTWSNICLKTRDQVWQTFSRAFESPDRAFEALQENQMLGEKF